MPRRPFTLRTLTIALLCLGASYPALAEPTKLISQPAISKDHLAFVYAGDIWLSNRQGQHPVRLTSHPASEVAPHFSPDGKWIAFSAGYDNNVDVYVIAVEGGQPRRLTWHPGADRVTGWSADGKRVLFTSNREVGNGRSEQLYEVALDGGYEQKVMKALAAEGAWSSDGKLLAYRPYIKAYAGPSGWRQHRGGNTPPIWVLDKQANTLDKLPHVNASDFRPMWVGNDIAFISDRNDGAANLFLYQRASKTLRQLTHETVWDVRSAAAFGNTIVYEVAGELKSLDVGSGEAKALPIMLASQAIQARPQWKDASKTISSAQLSPNGKRVLFTARGEVFSVPVKEGMVRNLSNSSGVRESDALWSEDGKQLAWLSDEGGRQSLVLRDAAGLEAPRQLPIRHDGHFALLAYAPDGSKVVLQDNHLNLYAMELGKGELSLIDSSRRRGRFNPVFSPDGQWLAYTIKGENTFTRVRLYSFASKQAVNVAETLVQTDHPVFGGNDYLYFTASIDAGPSRETLDMSTQERPLREGIFALVLSANGRSPLPPKTGDEESPKAAGDGKGDKAGKDDKADKGDKAHTRVDLAGLAGRLVPIPVPRRNYDDLSVGADGALYYLVQRQPGTIEEAPSAKDGGNSELYRYSLDNREEKLLKNGVQNLQLSADRKKWLVKLGEGRYEVGDAGEKYDAKPVDVAGLRALIDPRQEWQQIFDEVWRHERDYFYDPKLHGLDWAAVRARYAPMLAHVQRREDLNDLLVQMIGELQVGHNRVGGGDVYSERSTATGLLGADFRIENGQYRISKIYRGDAWNPFLVAPLAMPGLDVAEGDAITAINGRALDARSNIFAYLEGTADKPTTLTIARDGKPARNVTVVPIANEASLRQWTWIEHNRSEVERLSGGKLGYIYLPDTADQGFAYFNRMFFAQIDKEGLVIDDRRNSGGQAANYVLETLSRKHLAGWKDRDGQVFNTPSGANHGPKALLIDQDAGSGGDFFPYGFKRLGLGKTIGTRTWGGLIGISANPPLIDGGFLTVPFFRFFTPDGEWRVENEGVAPDMEVELDPLAVNAGRDTQLEAAVTEVMQQLKSAKPVASKTAPPYPTVLGK